ncbi:MAG: tripartite tricarboxylate transporter TctB family protein [Acidobacteria bacterium]|nr:tripartite tricarboxylate transporter TctB family protein [Acidobacteriota bacterium]
MTRDLGFGCAGLALAGGYYALAAAIPDSALADAVGPAGLPAIYAFVLAGLSLILIAQSIRGRPVAPVSAAAPTAPASASASQALLRPVGLLLMGAVYVSVVSSLGYVVSLAGLIFAVTWYQGGSVTRQAAIVSVAGAALFWVLFVRLLGIPHPPGVWPDLF